MIARFTGPLVIEEIGHERWIVREAFRFVSGEGNSILVPAGFETDLASVPSVFQSAIGKIGYWSQPAVTHDLLYHRHRTGVDNTLTRLDADNLFLEGIKLKAHEYSVSNVERKDWAIYGGVRIGGLESWETPVEKKERIEMLNSHITDEE